ncbi:hypothetical protein Tco_0172871 [Tanacetum coccineum]
MLSLCFASSHGMPVMSVGVHANTSLLERRNLQSCSFNAFGRLAAIANVWSECASLMTICLTLLASLVPLGVINPKGHETWPANPMSEDVGGRIVFFSSVVSCLKQCSYMISVKLPPSMIGSSKLNVMLGNDAQDLPTSVLVAWIMCISLFGLVSVLAFLVHSIRVSRVSFDPEA